MPTTRSRGSTTRSEIEGYVRQIEPIRLGVNRLLHRADPILHAFAQSRALRTRAAARMAALERQFAAFTVRVAAIAPAGSALASLHAGYAGTFILEDAYLSALASGL
ncbi:MAG: hypothetical protein WBQ18_12720, partial [Solirubrobacteraceae bacterium]